MGDPIAEIEAELRRSIVTQEQANDHRKRLNNSFANLSQDDAATLLRKIFTLNGARLPLDFRRLSRGVRLELLLQLAMRLGTQTSKNIHDSLTGAGDTPLKKGLRVIFPDYTKTQRNKFIQALAKGIPPGVPRVLLVFRNKGRFSRDNQAPAKTTVPDVLGPRPDTGNNQMEIRGVVSFHRPDAEYRFGRTIGQKSWYLAGKTWKFLETPIPAGTNDNAHSNDEDDHPDNDHIYSIDTPGFTGPTTRPDLLGNIPPGDRDSVTEAAYMINATETVEVKVGQGSWSPAGGLDWFSVTWLEKVNGTWRRKQDLNVIETGSLIGLDEAKTPDEVAMP